MAYRVDRSESLRAGGVLIVEQGGRGGIADYTSCLATALAGRGIPVTLATARDHRYHVDTGVRVAGTFAYTRGHSSPARLVRRLGLGWAVNGLRFLAAVPRLVRLSRGSAVVHLQGWESNALGLIAAFALRASGAKIVYTAHNTFERARWALDGTRLFHALAETTIVHTEADRSRLSGAVAVIPHGHYAQVAEVTDQVAPEVARASLKLPAEALVVLLFGVLRPDKGLDDVLEAVAAQPDWYLLVAGEEHGALRAAAAKLRSEELAGRVTVVEGFAEQDRVATFFAAADLVALPYKRASQSGVLHLAYGFGRMAVVYPVGGLVEAVVPGTSAFVCTSASPHALAEALRDASAVGRAELHSRGAVARDWARQRFAWDTIAEATESVYLDAIAGLAPGPTPAPDAPSGNERGG